MGVERSRWNAFRGLSVGVAAVVASSAAVRPVAAQVIDAPSQAAVSTSPSIDRPGLLLTPSLDVAYDSNIFRTNDSITPNVDDEIVTPRVQADYVRLFGPHDLHLHTDLAYQQYVSNSDRSRGRYEVDGDARLRFLGACQLQPSARYLSQLADYGDINRALDDRQRFSTLALQASCPREAGFFPDVKIERDTTRNSANFIYADQTGFSYRLAVDYARPSLGLGSVYYSRLRSTRDNIGIVNYVDRAGLTFARDIVSSFALSADLHYLDATSDDAKIRPYRGLGWNGRLTVRPTSLLVVDLATERTIVNDTLVPAGFAVQSDYTLDARLRISTRTVLTAQGQLGRRSFRRDPNLLFSTINSDKFSNFSIGAIRQMSNRIDLQVEGRRSSRRTDSGANDFDVNVALLSLSYKF